MADLDLRKVRYFLAVAEHLNFGRAAAALHIAQPVLTRQIRALEKELHARLFDRDQRHVELTEAGKQLATDAPGLLAEADAARLRVSRAARGSGTFVVGFMPGLIVSGPVRSLGEAHPDLSVEVRRTGWDDQVAVILDGRVDVGYVRLPVDQRGLTVERLFEEPRVAVLPAGHPLAGAGEITVAELADEHLLQDPGAVPEWRDIATEPRGRDTARRAPSLLTVEEKLEHVAIGHGIVVLPLSTAAFYRRPDVAQATITDIGPNRVCLAWRAGRRSRLISEFVALARAEHADRH
ncbi:LysR family transcriptional regulator [Streptomyces sp. AK02-01A]|uniref:LysR family transcriptional regulator n=1 Tax=Streptomyces sp. AK02-01A TaxID=3028648 RepID=UPI0029AF5C2F|nr:LysR substrate-binding domain-containing protein [Streptomyces sp. AK02-01A]MDX3853394.1 LysR substrate-binding domain-containing protein [Streptomyces sp. AK02-01A]